MEHFDKKAHWENIYTTKELKDVSWYQAIPETSLSYIHNAKLPLDSSIIDVGGGDSFLVDHLLALGYKDISVLDISAAAIEKAKQRLGEAANSVTWIVEDASQFVPSKQYDFWHDRAAFHFLTDETEVNRYVATASAHIKSGGHLVIGTFSEQGPLKCSGIEIKQYSEESLKEKFSAQFKQLECKRINHPTPFNTVQNFVFCHFQKS